MAIKTQSQAFAKAKEKDQTLSFTDFKKTYNQPKATTPVVTPKNTVIPNATQVGQPGTGQVTQKAGTSATSQDRMFALPGAGTSDPIKKPVKQEQPVSPETSAPTVDTASTTDQAKALLNEQRAAKRQKEIELFGKAITPGSDQEEVDLFLSDQKEEKTRLEKQIESMNKVDQSQFNQNKANANSSVDATTAQFAANREGVVSSGNTLISSQFKRNVDTKVDNARTQLNMVMDQRANLLKDLEKAQDQGKTEVADGIIERLASAENQIRKEQLKLAEYADKARTEAFDFLEKAPAGALAGMDPAAIAESFGVDGMTAGLLIQMDTKKQALEEKQFEMDEVDYAYKMSQIESNIASAKWAGMTPEMKNFEHYKNMIDYDPAGAQQFAEANGLVEKSFFSDYQQEWSGMSQNRVETYSKTGAITPIKSKYAYNTTADGRVSFEQSAPAGQKLVPRGECGMFVNDCLNGGPGLMGDSAASKHARINSTLPVAGGAFVEYVDGEIDHTGMVEKVYPDMSFDIRESNYVDTHVVSTANIKPGTARWKSIVEQGGFYVPEGMPQAKAQPGTDSMYNNPTFNSFAQGLADGKVDITDLKSMGMTSRDIAMLQQKSFDLSPSVGSAAYKDYQASIKSGQEGEKTINDPQVAQAAEAIFSGSSTLTLSQIPQDMRIAVESKLVQMRDKALESGDVLGAMRASAGGKDPSDSFTTQFEKSINVVNQVQGLAKLLTDSKDSVKGYAEGQGIDASPFTAWWKKFNKYDEDSQGVVAAINGIVPNLARGIFGEVGVLTDADIAQYTKVVPNLSQPEKTQKVISALLLTNLSKTMETKVSSQAALGRDVSGAIGLYEDVKAQIQEINAELGIVEAESENNPFNTIQISAPKNFSDSASAQSFLNSYNE